MARRLIINADDLGHPTGTVPAVAELYEAGAVTSTTAMVNQPGWPEAAAYLRDHPKLGAGVHLVMTEGAPVLPSGRVRSLVDPAGRFRTGASLLLRIGRLRIAELGAEWRAQIERFIADVGRPPDHLDLHRSISYVLPAWFHLSLRLAQEFNHLPVRMPFDDALDRKAPAMAAERGVPAWYVRWQGRRHRQSVARYGLKCPDYFEMSFSRDGHRTTDYLLGRLEKLPEGTTELLAHPGLEGWRGADYRALRDPRVRQTIGALGTELVTFADL
jgi:predicted glycoside hydrolase/deacetylase ChbG (UPF0249 family)